ncbi:MAG: ABC transporter substrate-binding protein [Actinomycetota bacterium]|nr:ABC transporter substrate-binding protein [Actinomycetota bacterium]
MNHRRQYRRSPWFAVPLAASLVLAACGEDEESAPTGAGTQGTSASTGTTSGSTGTTSGSTGTTSGSTGTTTGGSGATGGEGSLAGICPETVVLQTDWNPEAEHGFVYELIGDGYEIDKGAVATRGPLVDSSGADTGVDFEIRSGGPAIGFETVTSQMYQDDDILLGYVYTDEAIQNAADFPTVAIEAGMDKNPQIIMWDPETYPDVETIADLGETDATVRYFGGAAYMEYFTSEGILRPDQVDGSYDGTPAAFIADEGAAAQQGFGSAEPFKYENEFSEWGKPVKFEYINDAGWENYGESIATRPENIEEYGECFSALVPLIQQASVDYVNDPAATNELILEAVDTYDNGWTYSPEVADYAVETMKKDGLLGNGPDDTLGNFDMDRINGLIEIARPVYAKLGQEPPAGLTAEDVATNEFIDPSIGL